MANNPTRFDYFDTPAGKTDLAWQKQTFARFANLAVPCALQLGAPAIPALAQTRASLRILGCDRAPLLRDPELSMLLCEESSVPLETESVDLILWPHGLDRNPNSCQILAEIARLLSPEGLLVVTFFNRHGPWSLRRKLAFAPSVFPDDICPCTVSSAKAQLVRAGLSCQGGAFGVYGIDPQAELEGKTTLEKAGDRWWPMFGNLVVLVAKKQVSGLKFVGKARFCAPKLGRFGAAAAGNSNKEAS